MFNFPILTHAHTAHMQSSKLFISYKIQISNTNNTRISTTQKNTCYIVLIIKPHKNIQFKRHHLVDYTFKKDDLATEITTAQLSNQFNVLGACVTFSDINPLSVQTLEDKSS